MTTVATPAPATTGATVALGANRIKKRLTSPVASVAAIIIALLWTIPTFGLLVTSFRTQDDITSDGWWNAFLHPHLTFANYKAVLQSSSGGSGLGTNFINSIVITIPSVFIPISLATLAAYAFAWIEFKGRNFFFVLIFALQIVPIQVTLIPLLSLYVKLHLANTFWTIWLSHSIFGLPLAIFLMHNFMKDVPKELIEAARVDGAGHVKIFFSVMLPLLKPALAAFGIFQFLWVWNDLLVALVFAGGSPKISPITLAVANLAGTKGGQWYLLSAAAFVSIIVPVAVFLSLQRFFVRGLLAGSVKG